MMAAGKSAKLLLLSIHHWQLNQQGADHPYLSHSLHLHTRSAEAISKSPGHSFAEPSTTDIHRDSRSRRSLRDNTEFLSLHHQGIRRCSPYLCLHSVPSWHRSTPCRWFISIDYLVGAPAYFSIIIKDPTNSQFISTLQTNAAAFSYPERSSATSTAILYLIVHSR